MRTYYFEYCFSPLGFWFDSYAIVYARNSYEAGRRAKLIYKGVFGCLYTKHHWASRDNFFKLKMKHIIY